MQDIQDPNQQPDDGNQDDADHDGAAAADSPHVQPANGLKKKPVKKKKANKTEQRFQRLEAMMEKMLTQSAQTTARQTPTLMTPASQWQSRFHTGLPRPTIPATAPVPRVQDTPYPRPQPHSIAARMGRQPDDPPPPPEALIQEPVAMAHIAEAIRHLEPTFAATGGKRDTILKPHMFIPRRHVNRKATDPEDISFPLFVNGMAGLILNKLPDQGSTAAALARHLREVAEDTIDRPWQVAREWSKTTFDKIQRGEVTWNEYSEIQRERLRNNMVWVPQEKVVYPCALYNAKGGSVCDAPDSHKESGITARHVCAHCYYTTTTLRPHSYDKCTIKKAPNQQNRASSVPPNARSGRPKLQQDPPKN